jgi:hypothetical protein
MVNKTNHQQNMVNNHFKRTRIRNECSVALILALAVPNLHKVALAHTILCFVDAISSVLNIGLQETKCICTDNGLDDGLYE